jgi:hypothetical protein
MAPGSRFPSKGCEGVMRMSEHLRLEINSAFHRSRPLDPEEPVPGCNCPACTGLSEDHPARVRVKPRTGSRAWAGRLEAARNRPILEVAATLGLEYRRRGKECVARCPFHSDRTPSFRINPLKGLWHCFSCGRGGDGIDLVRVVGNLSFVEAIEMLTGNMPRR